VIYKTKGIVLNYIKFKESSIICKIFTESFGLQSYIINGVRNLKSSKNISLFQPLTLVDLVVYNKSSSDIQRIKEIKVDIIYLTSHTSIKKVSVCLFLSELLTKILSNEPDQNEKFNFLYNSFIVFDQLKKDFNNFHIQFLLRLTKIFGFEISDVNQILNSNSKSKEINAFVLNCISMNFNSKINSNYYQRNEVLKALILYFSQSLGIPIKVKSLKVLKEVFNPTI
jgi:DNA repair protein RecO (recombination protein O)|tara:strand:+ start:80744 stop:81421 length:678 start_codon:yes stop_codon:yes gene_type:complete